MALLHQVGSEKHCSYICRSCRPDVNVPIPDPS